MHQVRLLRGTAKRVQPLQQLRSIRVVAELLQRGDLRADGNLLAKHLHLGRAVLDGESSRTRRLEADEQYQVSRIGEAQHQVVQYASTRDHAAGRDDNARILGIIDLLRVVLRDIEMKVRPPQ